MKALMLIGLLCALGAGLMWGLVFIAPLLLGDYPGIALSFGRYIAFGLIALVPAVWDRRRITTLQRRDWMVAAKLSLVGNLLYYAALASAIQLADAPLPAMIIGTLPVVIAGAANLSLGSHPEAVRWSHLLPSLGVIAIGLFLVNWSELTHLDGQRSRADYALGAAIAVIALAAWTWYPIENARHLKNNPHIASSTWATAQGLMTLPMALIGYLLYGIYTSLAHSNFAYPLGPRPAQFIGLMLVIGLCASWLGTLLWNHASQRLPTTLTGQLIVFETLAALLYAFIVRGTAPETIVLIGVGLLFSGVLLGMRVFAQVRQTA
jgi:drug/metabolite transporter (DMT)-like permease